MTSISQLINTWAKLQISMHPIKVEWKSAIVITTLVKLLTMLFSAYAAYTFFYSNIVQVLENQQVSTILSITVLVFLEAINAVFLGKVFKFFFRKKYKLSLLTFILVSALYSLSFISSTEGLAQKQSAKIDKTQVLKERQKKQLIAVNQSKIKLLNEVDALISSIQNNPVVWSNGKRKLLSLEQQNNILQLNRQKLDIRKNFEVKKEQLKTDFLDKINQNQGIMAKTANQYYQVMAIVIAIQFVVTGILIYLLYQVYLQENRQEMLNENLTAIRDNIYVQASHFIQQGIYKAINDFFHQNPSTKTKGKAMQKEIEADTGKSTDTWLTEKSTKILPTHLSNKIESMDTEIHKQYCIKHKTIAEAIKNNVNIEKTFLTKEDIETLILPNLIETRYKSASLIRKVFMSMKHINKKNI